MKWLVNVSPGSESARGSFMPRGQIGTDHVQGNSLRLIGLLEQVVQVPHGE